MASPHTPYGPTAGPQPGPSYGPPPPHIQYSYPGPTPAPYYPYPMQPMNGHHAPPLPGRIHNPGRARFNPQRGGAPAFYPPALPPQHHNIPPTVVPISTPPPMSPAGPFHHPQKYQHQLPYVSPYHLPQPNAQYGWPGQTLSPLPKQFTMLPPMLSPENLPAQPQHPHLHQSPQLHSMPEPQFVPSQMSEGASPRVPHVHPVQSPHLTLTSVDGAQEETDQAVQPLSGNVVQPGGLLGESVRYQEDELAKSAQQDSEDAADEVASNGNESSTSRSPSPDLTPLTLSSPSTYVIWSRRPRDPTNAPGVTISHYAFPPADILRKALDLPTPPASPKPRRVEIPEPDTDIQDEPSQPVVAPSSSTTETTPACSIAADTPVPGSPFSSATSVSAAVGSPTKANTENKIEPSVPTEAEAQTAEPATRHPVVEQTPAISVPSIAPAAPKPAAGQKKLWAAVAQSSDSMASSSKTRLPVSNVVGFSVPATSASAATPNLNTTPSIATANRNELLQLLTHGPSGSSSSVAATMKIRPRGLVNTGNMCFANAVLQILVYCAPFHRFFFELRRHLTGPVVGSQREGTKATPLVDATIRFLNEFVPDDSNVKGKEREDDSFDELDSFIPTYVYDAMKEKKRFANMIGGHQEDAEEFLGFFLDTLEEELLAISQTLQPKEPPKPEAEEQAQDGSWMEVGRKNKAVVTRIAKTTDSPITRIFGGKFRSTLRTSHQRDSVTIEDWRSLQLDIQPENVQSLREALQHISHPQPVQISIPTRPNTSQDASQQVLIEALPPVLILHMKRFLYDTKVGDVVKVGKQVSFSPELDVPSEIISLGQRTAQPVKYQLFGVLYHHGPSASGGHYTLDVLHPNRELSDRPRAAWIRIDDELVSDVRPEDVFGGQEREDRQPYLLFYRRMTAWGPARTN